MKQKRAKRLRMDAGASNRHQPPPPPPPPTCLLESLPSDVAVVVLAAADSATDLYALLRASPAMCRVFLLCKQAVLFSFVTRQLGPALRDAVAVTHLLPNIISNVPPDRYVQACERMLESYVALPRSTRGLAAVVGPSLRATIALIRFNHHVHSMVDIITNAQLIQLRKISRKGGAGPARFHERRRLAKVLVRHQLLVHLELRGRLPHRGVGRQGFVALFRPWEKEQLWSVHRVLEAHLLPARAAPRPWLSRDMAHFYDFEQRARTMTIRDYYSPWPNGHKTYMPFFDGLAGGPLPEALRKSLGRSGRLARMEDDSGRIPGHLVDRPEGVGVPVEFRGTPLNALRRRENELPRLTYDENGDLGGDDDAPPFAWVEAHEGVDCQRWGSQLGYEVLLLADGAGGQGRGDYTVPQLHSGVRQVVSWWRELGFMFWDRERVECFQKRRLPIFETGWLTTAANIPHAVDVALRLDRLRKRH
ncbi:hypothetical protein PG985_001825 [Apiospora marii]|uniref:F-box domain-containing protein n=1 Tax=Apiospora marii TaxID=335849 RepID=A0ABR1S177_9PEZI